MSVDLFLLLESLADWVKLLRKVWVGPGILWPWRVGTLDGEVASSASATHPLFLQAGVNLFLYLLLVTLNLILHIISFLLELVFLKLQQCLLLNGV